MGMEIRKIHLIGIGGTGMGSLAILLKEAGYQVRGSDQGVYPPMSVLLREMGIPWMEGYGKENLSWKPDLVVVGNVVSRNHPEVRALQEIDLPYKSFPQTLYEMFLRQRHPIVVAGTHGKTSTSSLLAWILESAGARPGFLIGGIPLNFGVGARRGGGDLFVVEGDEYETAFFDKGPKMWHYRPRTAILTSIEFDHAEMFRDLGEVKAAFEKFVLGMPADGRLAVCSDDPIALEVARRAACPLLTYGLGKEAKWRGEVIEEDEGGRTVRIFHGPHDFMTLRSPLSGRQNLRNLLGSIAVVHHLGFGKKELSAAVPMFRGVARRQQLLGVERGIRVIDDFAHHPTAVRETLGGVRTRYPAARLWAVFEPRTNTTRRRVFQSSYAESFDAADRILIAAVHDPHRAPKGDRFSPETLARDLRRRGREASFEPDREKLLRRLTKDCREGDVVVFLSNGSFGSIQKRLMEALGR